MICKILGLFVKVLAADKKYSLLNRDTLTQLIDTQLSNKQKTFYQSFSAFSKLSSNLEHFLMKCHSDSLSISDIPDCESLGYIIV